MWNYEKRLQYPVKITQTNPKIAQIILSQFGGPDGELMTVGALSGLGKTHLCSVISILLTSARIPLAILLTATSLKLLGVWWALTLTSVIKGVIFVCAFYWVVRNSRNLLRRKGIQMLMKISITIKMEIYKPKTLRL